MSTAPKESPLVTAILTLARLHRDLIRLQRHPSGEWTVGRFEGGPGVYGMVPAGRVRGADAGWPDLSGFVPARVPKRAGKAILVECKRSQAEQPTDLQVENLTAVVEAGGVGILAWDAAQFWSEYLEAIGMEERGGLIVPERKPVGSWKACECAGRAT